VVNLFTTCSSTRNLNFHLVYTYLHVLVILKIDGEHFLLEHYIGGIYGGISVREKTRFNPLDKCNSVVARCRSFMAPPRIYEPRSVHVGF
jgi:hypothetical protein